ncbi:MAG: S16 family serine protease [Candidatus Micrarchaeota archaeon]
MRKLLLALAFVAIAAQLVAAASQVTVPAIDANGEGLLTTVVATAGPGTGKVSLVISDSLLSHFLSVETQQSAKSAVAAAATLTGIDKTKYYVEFDVKANAEVVDGPSGGAAMAIAAAAEFSGKNVRSDLAVTGSISPEGIVGKVGGVAKKTEAAGKLGVKILVVPAGQSLQDNTNLTQQALAKWGLQVVEARTLEQATAYAFSQAGTRVTPADTSLPEITLEKIVATGEDKPLGVMARNALGRAQYTAGALNNTPLAKYAQEELALAGKLLDEGYYYSAANAAFLTHAALITASKENSTREELLREATALRESLDALPNLEKDDGNLEWAVASELRWYWADSRLRDANDTLTGNGSLRDAAEDLAVAGLWANASLEMAEIAQAKSNGRKLNESTLQEAAETLIKRAANETRDALDDEADFHLEMAELEFEDGAYATAVFDASFAIAFATAEGENARGAAASVPPASELPSFGTAWARYYFAHALYNKQEWARSRDPVYAFNAAKLRELAIRLDAASAIMRGGKTPDQQLGAATALPETTPGSVVDEPKISVVITEEPRNATVDRNAVIVALLVIAAAFIILVIAVKTRGPATSEATELKARLDSLDNLMAEGKIAEATYERLHAKYSRRLARLKRETKPAIRRARKRHAQAARKNAR